MHLHQAQSGLEMTAPQLKQDHHQLQGDTSKVPKPRTSEQAPAAATVVVFRQEHVRGSPVQVAPRALLVAVCLPHQFGVVLRRSCRL